MGASHFVSVEDGSLAIPGHLAPGNTQGAMGGWFCSTITRFAFKERQKVLGNDNSREEQTLEINGTLTLPFAFTVQLEMTFNYSKEAEC